MSSVSDRSGGITPRLGTRRESGSLYGWLYRRILFPVYEGLIRRRPTLRYLREAEATQWLDRHTIERKAWADLWPISPPVRFEMPRCRSVSPATGNGAVMHGIP